MRDVQMTFDDFVAARLPALLRHATVLAGDPHEAEDVVQDALINAQRHWSRIARLDAPESYVRRMIVNELISVRRRVRARLRRERYHPPEPVGDGAERLEQRDALVRLIRRLPPRQRVVIALRYFDDLGDAEIADIMGCGIANVRSQASRALATLRRDAASNSAAPNSAAPNSATPNSAARPTGAARGERPTDANAGPADRPSAARGKRPTEADAASADTPAGADAIRTDRPQPSGRTP